MKNLISKARIPESPPSESSPETRLQACEAQGKQALEQQDYKQAQRVFKEALELARQQQRSRKEVQCLIHLAAAEEALSAPQQALQLLQEALEASDHPLNQSYRELILHRMGILLAGMNLQSEARQCLEQALQLHQLNGNVRLTILTRQALQKLSG